MQLCWPCLKLAASCAGAQSPTLSYTLISQPIEWDLHSPRIELIDHCINALQKVTGPCVGDHLCTRSQRLADVHHGDILFVNPTPKLYH